MPAPILAVVEDFLASPKFSLRARELSKIGGDEGQLDTNEKLTTQIWPAERGLQRIVENRLCFHPMIGDTSAASQHGAAIGRSKERSGGAHAIEFLTK